MFLHADRDLSIFIASREGVSGKIGISLSVELTMDPCESTTEGNDDDYHLRSPYIVVEVGLTASLPAGTNPANGSVLGKVISAWTVDMSA